jgi:hypothetical protein
VCFLYKVIFVWVREVCRKVDCLCMCVSVCIHNSVINIDYQCCTRKWKWTFDFYLQRKSPLQRDGCFYDECIKIFRTCMHTLIGKVVSRPVQFSFTLFSTHRVSLHTNSFSPPHLSYHAIGIFVQIHFSEFIHWPVIKETKLRGLSPRANYTDRVTAVCRRS